MYPNMPPTNPRKRQAPGSPIVPEQHAYHVASQMPGADYSRWGQGSDNTGYNDQTGFNLNTVNYDGVPINQGFDPSLPNLPAALSTQLARRPANQRSQLVARGQRGAYDGDPWGQFGDDTMMEGPNATGALEENDNIELLEEKAAVAKRDATAKRKQIPPFVQKLSR